VTELALVSPAAVLTLKASVSDPWSIDEAQQGSHQVLVFRDESDVASISVETAVGRDQADCVCQPRRPFERRRSDAAKVVAQAAMRLGGPRDPLVRGG